METALYDFHPSLSLKTHCFVLHTVGKEWRFKNKVDPWDKLLFTLEGDIHISYKFHGTLISNTLKPGQFVLIPAHLPVNYLGSKSLQKAYVYFHLENSGIPLVLKNCTAPAVSDFDPDQLRHAAGSKQKSTGRFTLYSFIGYCLGCVINRFEEGINREMIIKERYKALTQLLDHTPAFTITLPAAAEHLGMAESTLSHNFKNDTGVTLRDFLKNEVITRAREKLSGTQTVKEIAATLGFDDELYFSKYFKRETGFTPSNYRESLKRQL